jgi:DNA-binding NarL/FixJ family response regulator
LNNLRESAFLHFFLYSARGLQMTDLKIEILLADDHDGVRVAVRKLLEARTGWHVCGEAANGEEAVRLAALLKPDIAVLDFEMPQLNGLEAARQIKRSSPNIHVLILTMHDMRAWIDELYDAGASACVRKSDGGARLIEVIECLSAAKSISPPPKLRGLRG